MAIKLIEAGSMNYSDAIKKIRAGQSVEINLTEQVCTKINDDLIEMRGPNAKTGKQERTLCSFEQFEGMYSARMDFKEVERPEPWPKLATTAGDSQ